jgi:hypothetical protein
VALAAGTENLSYHRIDLRSAIHALLHPLARVLTGGGAAAAANVLVAVIVPPFVLQRDPSASGTVLHSRLNDDTCRIPPEFRGHPLFAGTPLEFVVPAPSKWKINDVIVKDRVPTFNPLGVSETRGTVMFESGHVVGCLFAVNAKYPETMYERRVLAVVLFPRPCLCRSVASSPSSWA